MFCVIVCTAERVVKTISADDEILGVTSVDDELFVLLDRYDNQVAVYNINDYKLLRHLHLPGFKKNICNDMTSCVRHKCLYVSNYFSNCIHRFDLTVKVSAVVKSFTHKHISKWSVPESPCTLSVTPSCNLLVTCDSPTSKLIELSADSGQCIRE